MFLDLAIETGKGDWSVIRGFVLLSLFEYHCDVSYPPVHWNCSGVENFLGKSLSGMGLSQQQGLSAFLLV